MRPFVGTLARGIWQRKREISHISLLGYAILTVTFLLQVAIARLLGVEAFGVYAANLAIVALVEVPLVVRGSEIAIRTLGEVRRQGEGDIGGVARGMVRHDIRLLVVSFLLLAATAWLFGRGSVDPLLITVLGLMIPAQAGFGVYKSYFTIFDKVADMVRFEFIYALALTALNLIGLLLWGIYGLAASMVLAALLKTWLAYRFTRGYLPRSEPGAAPLPVPSLTRDGTLSITRNLFANGLGQVDVILLGLLQKPETVALYKIGKSLASLPIKIAYPVWRYLQPKLMQAIQGGDRPRVRRLVLAGAAVLFAVMLLLLPPIVLLGEGVLVFLYGEPYRGAFDYFLILLIGVWAFHGIAGWFKFWSVVTRAQLFTIGVYATASVAVIVLGTLFGTTSPIAMAYVVTGVLLAMSGVAFASVLRR